MKEREREKEVDLLGPQVMCAKIDFLSCRAGIKSNV